MANEKCFALAALYFDLKLLIVDEDSAICCSKERTTCGYGRFGVRANTSGMAMAKLIATTSLPWMRCWVQMERRQGLAGSLCCECSTVSLARCTQYGCVTDLRCRAFEVRRIQSGAFPDKKVKCQASRAQLGLFPGCQAFGK
eukprot:5626417-Amphidinium_carterae.2